MVGKRGSLKERFEAKFTKAGPTECWPWMASTNGVGYGLIWDKDRGRRTLATRVSYELYKGAIPNGALILHSCDNPICVNPAHLSAGSHKQNVADMDQRGRRVSPQVSGSSNPYAKLTDADVIAIRRAYIAGEPSEEICAMFGVASVGDYTGGRAWKHLFVAGNPTVAELKKEAARRTRNNSKLTADHVREIRKLLSAGARGIDLAAQFGVHKATISDIRLGKIWADA